MKLLKNVIIELLKEVRLESPTRTVDNGVIEYRLPNGKFHREDGPAVDIEEGSYPQRQWWINGKKHREGGLPAVEYADGSKIYYVNDRLHREDGPAIVNIKNKARNQWWINGEKIESATEWIKSINSDYILYNLSDFSDETFQIVNDLLRDRGFKKEADEMTNGGSPLPGDKKYVTIPNELNYLVYIIMEK